MQPLLTIENLRVDYPGVAAVKGVSLALYPGQACALVGPNGAGKTSCMRAIAGLKHATSGRISIGGHDISTALGAARDRLGYMSDFAPMYDKLKVWEYLDHYARAYAVATPAARIARVLEMVQLTGKREALCGGLSRGMKQRLQFAKTLLHDPDVLLLDEPASGLDPLGRQRLRDIILKLRGAGKAVLVSSHILSELSAFCNHVAIMETGRLRFIGPVEGMAAEVPERPWQVCWRHEHEQALEILKNTPGVEQLTHKDLGAAFSFTGMGEALDGLLKDLVLAGVPVTEWRAAGDDLETIFFASGAKELS